MTDLRAYAREAARRAGCDPDLFERQIQQESGFNPDAFNAGSGAAGIAQIVARFHPDVDPSDPIASLDYAARWMAALHRQYGSYRKALAAYNWGPGRVATWDGSREALPDETRRYLDIILGAGWPEPSGGSGGERSEGSGPLVTHHALLTTERAARLRVTDDGVRLRAAPSTSASIVTTLGQGALVSPVSDYAWRQVRVGDREGWIAAEFLTPVDGDAGPIPGLTAPRYRFDPDIPTELQVQDWTCSIRSTMWLLKSIGIAVTAAEAQDRMYPRYVSPELGLLDATGAGIVECLREFWGVAAFNLAPASFDEVAHVAGSCPVAIGGRVWGHWSAVRRVNGAGDLALANPGGTGPRYGQQTLNRQQFEQLGWFSAVVIPVD